MDTRKRGLKDAVTMRNRQQGGTGAGINRPCARCVYPCTGGETLHSRRPRKGQPAEARACCRSFCPCIGFEAEVLRSRAGGLNQSYIRLNGKGRGP